MNIDKSKLPRMDKLAVCAEEAAELLGVSRSMVFLMLKEGSLQSVKIGKRRLIPMQALDAFLAHLSEKTS